MHLVQLPILIVSVHHQALQNESRDHHEERDAVDEPREEHLDSEDDRAEERQPEAPLELHVVQSKPADDQLHGHLKEERYVEDPHTAIPQSAGQSYCSIASDEVQEVNDEQNDAGDVDIGNPCRLNDSSIRAGAILEHIDE